MTHDTTRHDKAGVFMLLMVCMSSCSVVEWWMSSWCIIASPLHEKVCEVFDGLGVLLMFHVHVIPSLVLWHARCVRLFAKKSSRMHSLFVHSWKNLPAYAPFSSCSSLCHVSSMCYYEKSLMTIWHQIQKSPSLPWCIVVHFWMQVTRREDKGLKLQKADLKPGCGL